MWAKTWSMEVNYLASWWKSVLGRGNNLIKGHVAVLFLLCSINTRWPLCLKWSEWDWEWHNIILEMGTSTSCRALLLMERHFTYILNKCENTRWFGVMYNCIKKILIALLKINYRETRKQWNWLGNFFNKSSIFRWNALVWLYQLFVTIIF